MKNLQKVQEQHCSSCPAINICGRFTVPGQQECENFHELFNPQYSAIKTAPWFNMVLKSTFLSGQCWVLLLVIVKGDGRLEFTTHKYNSKDNSIYSGNYYTCLDKAIMDFNTRCDEKGI